MRLLICAALLLASLYAGGDDEPVDAVIAVTGKLQYPRLDEVSGIASSLRDDDMLWLINDDGPGAVHAIDLRGRKRALVNIRGAKNRDWEDLARFELDGVAYLAVADIGDNDARRDYVTVYIIAEPGAASTATDIAWQIDFRYPDGPRDAEALAIDADGGKVYVLSKRDLPAQLYELPLQPHGDTVVADYLGSIGSLPQPSTSELQDAQRNGYYWQPTAMDFSADGRSALVLTYGGIYFYPRGERQDWLQALNSPPRRLSLGPIRDSEALAFGQGGLLAFLTVEKKYAPLYRIDLTDVVNAPH